MAEPQVIVHLELSQGEAHVLFRAISRYLSLHPGSELVQETFEKVDDALLAGGYCPEEAVKLP